jgi:murein DD-endopeptidase MepM/ murein hydrolase activator NlpD
MPPKRVIYRNPVPGTIMKRPLPCIDLDPATLDPDKLVGSTCRNKYRALPTGVKYKCPNLGSKGCERGAFLYPRKLTDHYFHFHQGIDLGQLEPGIEPPDNYKAQGMPILSVTDGVVTWVQEWDGDSSGYGTAVAIYDSQRELLFWYAHCKQGSVTVKVGEAVVEGQEIAKVGNTGKAGDPHLHFEVLSCRANPKTGDPEFSRIRGREPWERELGNRKASSPRLDPLEELEKLGPWGARQVFEPLGDKISPEIAERLHQWVEVDSYGGYFPLGANNFWHGGVHLPAEEGELIHAPCDGTIVAVRLASTEASGTWTFGHTSFILIRHEVPKSVYERMQQGPEPPAPGPEPEKAYKGKIAVGRKVSDPAAVNKAKARLHELGHYSPDDPARLSDGKVEAALGDAIKSFQRTIPNPYKKFPEKWPDGVIDIPGHTWRSPRPIPTARSTSSSCTSSR